MTAFREWIVRLWQTFRPGRSDADFEQELRSHLQFEADARGGRVRHSGVAQAAEAMRDQRGLRWLEDLGRDLQYGVRMLSANPGFALVAILSLALGIGANAAVFSFADALILRPLSVPHPANVVTVGWLPPSGRALVASYPDYLDVRDRSRTVAGLVAFTSATTAMTTTPRATPVARIGMFVTPNFFDAMELTPVVGRGFVPDDGVVGGAPVLVLGNEFWTREYGGDVTVIGRSVVLNGIAFTVVGVAPPEFTGLDRYTRFEFYAPLVTWPRVTAASADLLANRDARVLTLKGRLAPGATIAAAQSELSVIGNDLERAHPASTRMQRLLTRTELQNRIAESPPNVMVATMMASLSSLVLLVACANIAGLLTSRAPLRSREVAVRLALGAGRGRIARQLLTESLLIAAAGALAGTAVGYSGIAVLRQFRIPTELPIVVSFRLDARVMMVSAAAATISALLFGLMPALRASRGELTAVMKGTDAIGSGRRGWGRAALVAGQIAGSVVLLAVAGFFTNDFRTRISAGPGFGLDHRLVMWFDPGLVGYDRVRTERFYDDLAAAIRRSPGVRSATVASAIPIDGGARPLAIAPEGFDFADGRTDATVLSGSVDDQYFSTLQIPIVEGRPFAPTDGATTPLVAVINAEVARRYWPGQSPIGKRFRLVRERQFATVVGVAQTITYSFLLESPQDVVYFASSQRPQSQRAVIVETTGDPAAMTTPIRDLVRQLDAAQPIYNLRTLAQLYHMRVESILLIIIRLALAMSVIGLVLSLVGLYGLVSYAVRRRTREIGIRMAIGAGQREVLAMVLREGALLAVVGLSTGLAASAGAARLVTANFRVGRDGLQIAAPTVFALIAGAVVIVTLISTYLPARRAARINPTEALRND